MISNYFAMKLVFIFCNNKTFSCTAKKLILTWQIFTETIRVSKGWLRQYCAMSISVAIEKWLKRHQCGVHSSILHIQNISSNMMLLISSWHNVTMIITFKARGGVKWRFSDYVLLLTYKSTPYCDSKKCSLTS